MKIAVIGASGRTGRVFVSEALAKGYALRAAVHHANNLPTDPKLEPVACDSSKIEDVANLISGCHAVVSLIGHVRKSPPDIQTKTIANLIGAAQEQGINRLISLTGTGVRFPGDKITSIDRIMNFSIKLIDPKRIQDGIDHAQVLKSSGLNWTLLRVLKLTNTKGSDFLLTNNGPAKTFVARREVARAIIELLENSSFDQAAPIISTTKQP